MNREPIVFLTGSFDLSFDQRSRLSLPAVVRTELSRIASGRSGTQDGRTPSDPAESGRGKDGEPSATIYILPGDRKGILAIYEAGLYESSWLGIPPTAQLLPKARNWTRLESSLASKVEPDVQGRIVIPDRLMKLSGLVKEVTLVGAQDHYEIWNREAYTKFLESQWENYEANFEENQAVLAPYRNASRSPARG